MLFPSYSSWLSWITKYLCGVRAATVGRPYLVTGNTARSPRFPAACLLPRETSEVFPFRHPAENRPHPARYCRYRCRGGVYPRPHPALYCRYHRRGGPPWPSSPRRRNIFCTGCNSYFMPEGQFYAKRFSAWTACSLDPRRGWCCRYGVAASLLARKPHNDGTTAPSGSGSLSMPIFQ